MEIVQQQENIQFYVVDCCSCFCRIWFLLIKIVIKFYRKRIVSDLFPSTAHASLVFLLMFSNRVLSSQLASNSRLLNVINNSFPSYNAQDETGSFNSAEVEINWALKEMANQSKLLIQRVYVEFILSSVVRFFSFLEIPELFLLIRTWKDSNVSIIVK